MKRDNMFEGNFGIEKETLRVSKDGNVVGTKHPFNNENDKFYNPHITVDFSEQQVEVISGINPTIKDAVEEIKLLTNIVYRNMNKDEYLWNYSMPFGDLEKATIATGSNDAVKYRKNLLKNSSFNMQLISGIHFNFSFKKEFTKKMSDDEINALYFKISKNYAISSFVIKQMFGMSPTTDFINKDKISYRQSEDNGYHNKDKKLKCYCEHESYEEYLNFINKKISTGEISSFREVYAVVRMKPLNAKRIQWIEVRNIDLDYTEEYGLNLEKLEFIHQFLMYLCFGEANIKPWGHPEPRKEFDFDASIKILEEMKVWMTLQELPTDFIKSYIDKMKLGKYDAQASLSVKDIIEKQVNLKDKIKGIPLKPIDDLELSTQSVIEEAYKEGMSVQMIDREKNIFKIDGALIEKATLNPFDSKEGLEIIDSKIKTNKFLKENNFKTTEQNIYTDLEETLKDYQKFKNQKIVIKPVSTNFSKGLTIFENDFSQEEFRNAIKFSLSFDSKIIIEKFIQGEEYRFLVIDSKIIGVLKRVPANVQGDGIHSIKELVEIKNKNKLRGTNYKLPLEKINIGKIEKEFIKKQGITENFIPKQRETIFLRKNSNISTGGDSYDVTDLVAREYKEIAITATNKLNLKVCGLDIIIPNIEKFGGYTILEMNWNPAIHMHAYPMIGIERNPSKAMIKLIKKYNKK